MHIERLMNQVMEQVRAQTTQMLANTPGADTSMNAEQKKLLDRLPESGANAGGAGDGLGGDPARRW